MKFLMTLALLVLLAACESTGTRNPISKTSSIDVFTGELRTQPAIEVTPSVEISAETAAVATTLFVAPEVTLFGQSVFTPPEAALFYIIYDPLAPNWSIKERALNADTYYFSLRAKSFRTGGDGEAIQILKRRALQLQRERGYASYKILDYSEGIESSTPLTHRVSEGTIQLVKMQEPARR